MATRTNAGMLEIEWAPCLLERRRDSEIEAFARRELGLVTPDIPYLTPCPWLARSAATLHQRLASRLDPGFADAVALVVSHENSCRYCYATVRALLRIRGMREARVQALEARLDGGEGNPRTAAVMAFARHMARSAPLVDAADRERLGAAGFSPEEFRDIALQRRQITPEDPDGDRTRREARRRSHEGHSGDPSGDHPST